MPEHLAIEIQDKIYTHLFGLPRHEIIAIAKTKQRYGMGAGLIYPVNDEDESVRDCLSKKALQALDIVGLKMAKYISATQRLVGHSVTVEQWKGTLDYAIEKFAYEANDAIGKYELWSE